MYHYQMFLFLDYQYVISLKRESLKDVDVLIC